MASAGVARTHFSLKRNCCDAVGSSPAPVPTDPIGDRKQITEDDTAKRSGAVCDVCRSRISAGGRNGVTGKCFRIGKYGFHSEQTGVQQKECSQSRKEHPEDDIPALAGAPINDKRGKYISGRHHIAPVFHQ